MENIDNLEMLLKQRDELTILIKQNKEAVETTLLDFLKQHCVKGDVTLTLSTDINDACVFFEKNKWYIRATLKFYTDDVERLAKGYEFDFHSSCMMTIYENTGIEINCGTSGGYYSTDKYQVARAHLISSIWDNETSIIEIAKRTFDYDTYLQYKNVIRQISNIEAQLANQKEKDAYNNTLIALRGAKYLAKRSSKTHFAMTENGCIDWTKEIGINFHFYDIEKIEKVTEKTVKTIDSYYRSVNHHYKLDKIILSIRRKELFIFDEIPQDYFEPKSEEAEA